MPICQHCHHKWRWSATFKKLFTVRKTMKCMHCGENQYQSAASRKVTCLLPLIAACIMAFIFLFNPLQTTVYLSAGLIFMISCLLMPFFIRLSNDDEALW